VKRKFKQHTHERKILQDAAHARSWNIINYKAKSLGNWYSAAYTSQAPAMQRFTISEVTAD